MQSNFFGSSNQTSFGQSSGFGSSLFGQPNSSTLFGSNTNNNSSSLFGGQSNATTSVFGQQNQQTANGSSAQFIPPIIADSYVKNGQTMNVNTKILCYTAMKDYQGKSIEEIRLEDYLANRKGGQASTSSLFGSTNTNQTSLFGNTANKPATNSLFGSSTNNTSTFGSSNLFGNQQQSTSTFGQPAGTSSLFGQTNNQTKSLFGTNPTTTAANTGNSMFSFGNTNTTATNNSLFGAKTFGQTGSTTGGIFGSNTQQNASPFGATNTGTSLFGANNNTQNKPLFGTTTTTTAASTGSLFSFGQTQAQNNTQTNSLFGGNKTFGTPQPSTGGLFGSSTQNTQQTGSLFGQTNNTGSLFGSTNNTQNKSLFGSNTATNSTTGTGGGMFSFGNTQTNQNTTNNATTGSLFGKPTFGATPAANTTGSLFGNQQNTTNTFGQSQTNTGTSLFGNTNNQQKSLFGTPATPANQTAGSSLFSFNNTNTNTQPGTTGGSLFGNIQQSNTGTTSLFGSQPQQQANTGGSLFGSTSLTGNAGTNAGTSSLFGTTTLGQQPQQQQQQLQQQNQVFQSVRDQQQVLDLVRSMPYGQSNLYRYMFSDQNANSITNSGNKENGRIGSVNNSNNNRTGGEDGSGSSSIRPVVDIYGNWKRQNESLNANQFSRISQQVKRSTSDIDFARDNRHKIFSNFFNLENNSNNSGFSSSTNSEDYFSWLKSSQVMKKSTNDSLLYDTQSPNPLASPLSSPQANNLGNSMRNHHTLIDQPSSIFRSTSTKSKCEWKKFVISDEIMNKFNENSKYIKKETERLCTVPISNKPDSNGLDQSLFDRKSILKKPEQELMIKNDEIEIISNQNETLATPLVSIVKKKKSETNLEGLNEKKNDTRPLATSAPVDANPTKPVHGVKLTRSDYYILPQLDELHKHMTPEGKCIVQDLIIGRRSFGHIFFPGKTDITGLDLDLLVHIRRREVIVYPEDDSLDLSFDRMDEISLIKKPPIGVGLNRTAEVSLDGIYPVDKTTKEQIKSPNRLGFMKFASKVEKMTLKMGAKFIDYRPDNGTWVFEVKHFSKYAWDDSDASDEDGQQLSPSDSVCGDSDKFKVISNTAASGKFKDSSSVTSSIEPMVMRNANPIGQGKFSSFLDFDNKSNNNKLDFGYGSNEEFGQLKFPSKFKQLASYEEETETHSEFDPTIKISLNDSSDEINESWSYPIGRENKAIFNSNMKFIKEYYQSCVREKVMKNYDIGLYHSNVMRVSFAQIRMPSNGSTGLSTLNLIRSASRNEKRSLELIKTNNLINTIDEQLLNAALERSQVIYQEDSSLVKNETSPWFYPIISNVNEKPPYAVTSVLESYLKIIDFQTEEGYSQDEHADLNTLRKNRIIQLITLCKALWTVPSERQDEVSLMDTSSELSANSSSIKQTGSKNGFEDQDGIIKTNRCMPDGVRPFNSYSDSLVKLTRKQSLMIWIKETCEPWLRKKFTENGHLDLYLSGQGENKSKTTQVPIGDLKQRARNYHVIFSCIIAGQLELAVRVCFACNMPNLAALISMSSAGNDVIRSLAQLQIKEWISQGIIQHMPIHLIKIYTLFSGQYELVISDKISLYVLEGVPWLLCLSAFIIFFSPYNASVEDCLRNYDAAWMRSNKYIASPIPPNLLHPYQDDVTQYFDQATLSQRNWPLDMAYNLMNQCVNPTTSLAKTLDPLGFSLSNCSLLKCSKEDLSKLNGFHPLSDWSTSWHLWRIIASLTGPCSMPQSNESLIIKLSEEYSDQLASSGLWEWSIFVSSHQRNPLIRTKSIKSLIERFATLTQQPGKLSSKLSFFNRSPWTNTEDFVLSRLFVPSKWLHHSRAILAHSLLLSTKHTMVTQGVESNGPEATCPIQPLNRIGKNLACLAVGHYLAAEDFQQAHDLAVSWILPDLILSSNPKQIPKKKLSQIILELLEPFAQLPLHQTPSNFNTGVGVYLAFAAILNLTLNLDEILFNQVAQGDQGNQLDEDLLEKTSIRMLRQELKRICDRLQMMPIRNLKASVVKCEMTLLCSHLLIGHIEATFLLCQDQFNERNRIMKNERLELVDQLQEVLSLMTEIGLPTDMQDTHLKYLYSLKNMGCCEQY